jgi:peroxiredoxin Q/BCP
MVKKMVTIGEKAPDFCLKDQDEKDICLKDFKDKWLVLYFYPKDNTSGCTLEAVSFTKMKSVFNEKNAVIFGISPDSPKSHCTFRDKHGLGITLLSDPDHSVLEDYGVWVLKKMYGREFYGVQRSTFLIDPAGIVRKIWEKVKVKGHAEEVYSALINLQK